MLALPDQLLDRGDDCGGTSAEDLLQLALAGGLMSLYALLQYNDTFSRAAALSPSIWVSPEKLSGLVGRAKLEPGTVLYMDYGSQEMGNHEGMRREFAEMCSKIMVRGIHLTSRLVPGGTHSEASWEKQLPFVFHTLMYELD